ncbi:AMP-binding protein [Promicromonospora sukumoe]|uniref:Acyl-CoA synthetase (AMP-forming)/AMP-acid ligase II n=1 Tax=Promicromonospora sukumoe TaxID=88382 RepID=A0A7W3JC53_9MICO|nr:AMP-binding protein [Promicromonospora sukumoe]MBA8810128.1 acyl-CoA synthetase (AMP-forming)/AMP-acid ligase II [Promicromonospora sukumoe]
MLSTSTAEVRAGGLAQVERRENLLNQGFHLVRSGVLAPGLRVHRDVGAIWQLVTWGPSIAGGYRASAVRAPHQTAFADEQRSATFRELDDNANRLANSLRDRGVGPRTPVAVLCRNHGGLVEAMVALAKLGATTLLLNSGLSPAQVSAVVVEQRPVLLLADQEFLDQGPDLPADLPVVSTWADDGASGLAGLVAQGAPARVPIPERPGRTVVMTSGTTSTPKGARRPQPHGLSEAASLLSAIPLRTGERMMITTPVFHTWGLAALQLGMALHAELVLPRRFDAEQALRTIAERRVTALVAVPVMLQRILDLPAEVKARYDTSSLRVVAYSGSAMPAERITQFLDEFGPVLYGLYGSTEASWASISTPADLAAEPTTAGRPPLGTRLGILDDDGRPVPRGAVGQICVGNGMLFEGYTNGTGQPMFGDLMATGDRGRLEDDGRLYVVGRADDMIVSGGENVFPRPVEDAIAALPEVADAAVLGVPDERFGQRFAAYVVLREGATLTAETLLDRLRPKLPRFSLPRDVHFLPELPRNPTGKVTRHTLPR